MEARFAGPIVVTGATGFIGRHVCRHLLDQGATVHGVARDDPGIPGVQSYRISGLDDAAGLARALAGAYGVVHLAGRAHVGESASPAVEALYRRVNADGAGAVLDAAAGAGVRRFILASSVKAVGEASGQTPWTEATDPRPADPYGRSKRAAEQMVMSAAAARGIEAVALRFPLVYGPGVKANMLRLFGAVHRRAPLPVGGIRNQRSLLYLGNLAAAVSHLLLVGAMGRGVYFLSDGRNLSTPELVRGIGRALGHGPLVVSIPEWLLNGLGRIGDGIRRFAPFPLGSQQIQRLTGSLAVDSSAFMRDFGFRPPYSVDEGLEVTARWYLAAHAG